MSCVLGSCCGRGRSPGVRECGRRTAANDRWRFVNEGVIRERFDHEQSEIDPAGQVAREHWVADMATPHRQAFACAFLQCATANNRPCSVARKDSARRLDLSM